ncbi:MAG: methylglyoxal synthase [Gemmataceae bacterium]
MAIEDVPARKRIALVAHDRKKPELLAWARRHHAVLAPHELFGTGTTGQLLETELRLPFHKFLSGPLGGDQQLGAAIAEGRIDVLIFFWDPLAAQPHEPDVRALLRMAVVWDVPVACEPTSATMIVTSPLMTQCFAKSVPDRAGRVIS